MCRACRKEHPHYGEAIFSMRTRVAAWRLAELFLLHRSTESTTGLKELQAVFMRTRCIGSDTAPILDLPPPPSRVPEGYRRKEEGGVEAAAAAGRSERTPAGPETGASSTGRRRPGQRERAPKGAAE